MKKLHLAAITISVVAAASLLTVSMLGMSEPYVYTASDITKANPNITVGTGIFSMEEDMENMKESVHLTLSGKVLSVGDAIPWEMPSNNERAVSIPVTIEVDKISKNVENLEIKPGQELTFYLNGMYPGDAYLGIDKNYDRTDSTQRGDFELFSYEAQFELDEIVVVHLTKENYGPSENDGNYFPVIGKFSKYKVNGEKAYNENYVNGESLDIILKEGHIQDDPS